MRKLTRIILMSLGFMMAGDVLADKKITFRLSANANWSHGLSFEIKIGSHVILQGRKKGKLTAGVENFIVTFKDFKDPAGSVPPDHLFNVSLDYNMPGSEDIRFCKYNLIINEVGERALVDLGNTLGCQPYVSMYVVTIQVPNKPSK